MGSKLIFYDKDGFPCPEEEAVKGEIVEYDENGIFLMSTLFDIKNESET